MAVLEDVKTLKSIGDSSKDNIINIYIRKGKTLISNYLNKTVDVETDYPDALVQYVIECMNKSGNEGLKQFGQGSRNGTYGNELSDSVLALLPVPYATITGA
ncbi:MAG: phage gp6-like head-tail connector protein [Anaerocolumna sp.]|jgi:hypothetical protein|nr:phage gp6-like head-tail connector protein [Anaerocolumna sp.]